MKNEVAMRLQEIIYKCQAWIDNEKYLPKRFKARSWSNVFAEKIIRELEAVMIREKFCLQNNKTFLPTFYFIRINPEDSLQFAGQKREILYEMVNNYVENCLKMLSIKPNRRHLIQISAHPGIQKGEIKIEHLWEESYQPKISINGQTKASPNIIYDDFSEGTIMGKRHFETVTENNSDDDFETVIGKRVRRLFNLEILHDKNQSNTLPIFQNEVVIGRGSQTIPVDVQLPDDFEISRRHAVLKMFAPDLFKLSVIGQNPALIAKSRILNGQTAFITWGDKFQIGRYLVNIQK